MLEREPVDRERAAEPARRELAARMRAILREREELETAVPGLVLVQRTRPVPPTSHVYEPSLAIIVHGRKHVTVGTSAYQYDDAHFLLTSINVPTITAVPEASPEEPYLSLPLKLDLVAASDVIASLAPSRGPEEPGPAIAVGPTTTRIFDATRRLVDLVSTPDDIPVLAQLIQRELLYLILTSPAGLRLRQIVQLGTQSHRVARAVTWLRKNYVPPLRLEELARSCGMGVSTLHHHFRRMTSMSPLQFQKHLRLHEARRLMLVERLDASNVAFRVGYESATQFSREYRRLFGAPPLRDVKGLRQSSVIGEDAMKIL